MTLNDNNLNGIDNYSSIYGYILAHMTDLNKDLYYTFDISNLIQNLAKDDGLDDTYNSTDYISNSSSTNNSNSLIKKPIPVKVEDLSWETKTLNNQTFQISNAGVTTFVYGYAGHNYLILATSLKDFFDIQGSLNTQ